MSEDEARALAAEFAAYATSVAGMDDEKVVGEIQDLLYGGADSGDGARHGMSAIIVPYLENLVQQKNMYAKALLERWRAMHPEMTADKDP